MALLLVLVFCAAQAPRGQTGGEIERASPVALVELIAAYARSNQPALVRQAPEEELARNCTYYGDLGITFPIAVGSSEVEEAYRVGGIPQINLIDRNGKIRAVLIGYEAAMEERLASQIRALLAEK